METAAEEALVHKYHIVKNTSIVLLCKSNYSLGFMITNKFQSINVLKRQPLLWFLAITLINKGLAHRNGIGSDAWWWLTVSET